MKYNIDATTETNNLTWLVVLDGSNLKTPENAHIAMLLIKPVI